MKRSQFFCGIAALTGMLILILDGKTALLGAREGLDLCIRSLIPSLFPFFVLSSLLTNALGETGVPMLRPLGKILGIPAGCESLLIPAYLGGYPAGAKCIGESYRQNRISRENAQRLLLFCSNCGPSFLFGILAFSFPRLWMLWAMWGIQIVGSVWIALCFPALPEKSSIQTEKNRSVPETLSASVSVMGAVCGWVILFRILIAFLQKWILWLFPSAVRVIIMGILELSNGCCALSEIADLRFRFLIGSAMLSFGGICVAMQTASAIGELPLRSYLLGKLLQGLVVVCLTAAFLYRIPVLLLLPVLILRTAKKVVAKGRLIVYNDSINQRRKPYAVS